MFSGIALQLRLVYSKYADVVTFDDIPGEDALKIFHFINIRSCNNVCSL